jgi:Asp-tRNA(Asn)/Glu-tRNA(Gln) amidotransferase A subunit family amidase
MLESPLAERLRRTGSIVFGKSNVPPRLIGSQTAVFGRAQSLEPFP